jgi:hypothetical protein
VSFWGVHRVLPSPYILFGSANSSSSKMDLCLIADRDSTSIHVGRTTVCTVPLNPFKGHYRLLHSQARLNGVTGQRSIYEMSLVGFITRPRKLIGATFLQLLHCTWNFQLVFNFPMNILAKFLGFIEKKSQKLKTEKCSAFGFFKSMKLENFLREEEKLFFIILLSSNRSIGPFSVK